ncbi:MAG: FHA domain-containing protein, partial [Solirubrobacterales bacterium]|nr:FHA domain-containing protein [Solirubrobacterales bacterium]
MRAIAEPPPKNAIGVVVYGDKRLEVPTVGLGIGRDSGNEIVIESEFAAGEHARIVAADGRWFVSDLESANGTYLNGERLLGASRWLQSGDAISVADE